MKNLLFHIYSILIANFMLICIFTPLTIEAQSARKQWEYTSNQPGVPNPEPNHFNKIKQLSNGDYLAVGYTYSNYLGNYGKHPSYLTLGPDGKDKNISYIYTYESALEGEFYDFVETPSGKVFVGIKKNSTTNNDEVFVLKINVVANPNQAPLWFTELTLPSFQSQFPNYHVGGESVSIEKVENDGFILCTSAIETGFVLPIGCDNLCSSRGLLLIRLANDLSFDGSFNNNLGWQFYTPNIALPNANGMKAIPYFDFSNVLLGFAAIGGVADGIFDWTRDVYLLQVDISGGVSSNSHNIYSQSSLGSLYVDKLPDQAVCGPLSSYDASVDERGVDLFYDPISNNFRLLANFNYFSATGLNCSSISYQSAINVYQDLDAVIINLNSVFQVINAINVDHFNGTDFNTSFVNSNGNIFVAGNQLETDFESFKILKLDPLCSVIWDRIFHGSGTNINVLKSLAGYSAQIDPVIPRQIDPLKLSVLNM